MFWLWPGTGLFWEEVHSIMVNILGDETPRSCMVLYFGKMTADRCLFIILIADGKRAITKRWYQSDPPTHDKTTNVK